MRSRDEIFKSARLDAVIDESKKSAYFDERLNVHVTVAVSGEEEQRDVEELLHDIDVAVGLRYVDSESDKDKSGSRPTSLENTFGAIPTATPSPLPHGNDDLLQADGVFVSSTPGSKESSSLARDGDTWKLHWLVQVDAARVRMNINKPLAALTSTITLRDRPAETASQSTTIDNGNDKDLDSDDELIDSWDSINLLEDLSPTLTLPTTRLPNTYDTYHPAPVDTPENAQRTLKRSYRLLIPISSALSVRMRAVNIPFLLSGHSFDEKPHLALGLELENSAESTFTVSDASIHLKEASGAEDSAEIEARRHALTQDDIPVRLLPSEQHNLIYVVVFTPPATSAASAAQALPNKPSQDINRPRRFNVRIRVSAHAETGAGAGREAPIEMKWNSVIDISNALVEDWRKNAADSLAGVQIPTATTAAATKAGARMSASTTTRPTSVPSSQRYSGPVAGSRRFTLTSLQNASEVATGSVKSVKGVSGGVSMNARASQSSSKHHSLTHSLSQRVEEKDEEENANSDSDETSSDSNSSNLNITSAGETVLLSVSVLKPTRSTKLGLRSPSIFSPGAYTPSTPRDVGFGAGASTAPDTIKKLDIFPIEVFIFNKSSVARRFVVNFASHNQVNARNQHMSTEERLLEAGKCEDVGVVPLENFVRFGPLPPGSCQSVNINFLALKEGTHCVDKLEVYDPDTGFSSRLSNVASIAVS